MMRRAVARCPRFPLPRGPWAFVCILIAIAGGCFTTETKARYPEDLYHPDYVKRTKAVAEFAEQRDKSQMPDAFQLLLDDDANIRLVAYHAIREMSPGGEDFGYRPYLPQDVRFGIVQRWQTWWVRNGEGPPVEASVEEPAAESPEEAATGEPVPGAETTDG
jgi:hypothetical protein